MTSERPPVPPSSASEARNGLIAVERAVADLRSGRPILLEAGGARGLVIGAEALDAESAAVLAAASPLRGRLALPGPRLSRIGAHRPLPGTLALPGIDPARVAMLALQIDARLDAPVSPADPLDVAALELLRIALLLPAAVVAPVDPDATFADLLFVADGDILAFRGRQAKALRIVGRAPVPLEGAPETEFIVFRGGEGLRDQVAIIVGKPDLSGTVPVRLHSACLTGDLFGSLKCDCGDQLRDTVARMAEGSGGILLYLDQEGRGNGIANKMRAYGLQAQGYDTYDADEVLGFGLDQRRFDFAAEMLRQLGVAKVQLITNNPEKIAALRASGLEVAAEQRVLGRHTKENARYLASKRDRAGHFIEAESAANGTD
ncbi:GTP cyclohydrolase II RibA [Aquabacter spiritensis]|uniref:GTP cyclohydrolase-2 n=1 Tax=Aquabacter spiritensis TaxID=933073 RepID=A0A4R3M7E9_9HYPH|nr:GTP cyclohydrolase II RibA [Aquabacter spiritensis]TCT07527.1 GTP cyclohydrolase II [Aquabacter spiritensis]